jgi:4-hydroxy-4-methyl-2-oxoglutarate aldolase
VAHDKFVAVPESLTSIFSELGAATLGECGALTMVPRLRAAWPGARLAAPAYPVRCRTGDNLAVHVALTRAPVGSALVVDVGEERAFGYWGEVLTTQARAKGIAGLVIDGGVRDIDAVAGAGFPIFSAMIALRGAAKVAPGTIGAPVEVGGVPVHAGDWVVGDADGVVIVPGNALDAVVAAGRARQEKENVMFERLRAGATTVELLDLDVSPIVETPVETPPS